MTHPTPTPDIGFHVPSETFNPRRFIDEKGVPFPLHPNDPAWEPGEPLFYAGYDLGAARQIFSLLDDDELAEHDLLYRATTQVDDDHAPKMTRLHDGIEKTIWNTLRCGFCVVSWSSHDTRACWSCGRDYTESIGAFDPPSSRDRMLV